MDYNIPIFITGTDGSGKTTLTRLLQKQLKDKGVKSQIVWSRYNNFFSKPLLAITRITGHNYYEKHKGNLFGYHEFENLPVIRFLYVLLQCIDVNIASHKNIYCKINKNTILICERGPWDTLADVILDTGKITLAESFIGKLFVKRILKKSKVFFISRSYEKILETRPELSYDKTLKRKIEIYQYLSKVFNWIVIENNDELERTQNELFKKLKS